MYLFDLGNIQHATEWPPVPFYDPHHLASGLPRCLGCSCSQLLKQQGDY